VIELTRKQIYFIRSTIRQMLGITSARRAPSITFLATTAKLLIQTATEHIAVEHLIEGDYRPEIITLPYKALQACEGQRNDHVGISRVGDSVTVQWIDGGIPQTAQYENGDSVEPPEIQQELIPVDRAFIQAMVDAVATTDNESTRYALSCIQLRGSDGRIAATDGRQALIQSGIAFPWNDEVLVPATKAFGTNAFRYAANVSLSRTDDWVSLRADDWTLHLKIEKDARFPNVADQIPDVDFASTTMILADADAQFLTKFTKKLPAASECNSPVTVDLDNSVAIRAKSTDQDVSMELILTNSERTGDGLCFNTNRNYLSRAASLGFRQVHLRTVDSPAFCREDRRAYIWALLGSDDAIGPNDKMTRIESPSHTPESSTHRRTTIPMPKTKQLSSTRSTMDKPSNVLAKAEALRDSLGRALSETRELISAIRANRKQSRIVESTLRSLKQLENIDA